MNNGYFVKEALSQFLSSLKRTSLFLAVSLYLISSSQAFSVGGVVGYTGNISNNGAGVSAGNGNASSGNLRIEFNINRYVAVGIYDTTGTINSPLFSTPSNNFPAGALFAADQSILVQNEINTASKFDLNGINSVDDQTLIINAMNSQQDVMSDDLYIRGAIYSNIPTANELIVSTDKDSLTLTGGTGSAPVYNFRSIAGIPSGISSKSQAPFTTPVGLGNKRNNKGFARFTIVGDLDESSVDLTTNGNWTGNVTIVVSGL